ncbi:unnamed protein product [Echinostoma caproni]|uniref:tRNA-dihydrouridine(47) synthase [NAD(P)(+)] n=1 Tax=Echinostoma caproni TaxID=27848 RepID=A0A3P8IA61_9TREM|nr:unnamed protein product [Echinostoma caproni]
MEPTGHPQCVHRVRHSYPGSKMLLHFLSSTLCLIRIFGCGKSSYYPYIVYFKVGNLPFRRVCKRLGAEITCGEMALATQLLQGRQSEWALLRRHSSEDIFGVQICGGHVDTMTKAAQLIDEHCEVDFVDINCGCPIDLIWKKKAAILMYLPLPVKNNQQFHFSAAKERVRRAVLVINFSLFLSGNGDVLTYEDYVRHKEASGVLGALSSSPWIFTEIREARTWDISASERLDILREFTNYGLELWGSDTRGVETTRRFLLEWLSFLYRFVSTVCPFSILSVHVLFVYTAKPRVLGTEFLCEYSILR